jgi:large subunit ribosomal protein L3
VAERKLSKPLRGVYSHRNLETFRHMREFRVEPGELEAYEQGQRLTSSDLFQPGDRVDVSGNSKGRGTAGVMKRHGFQGARATHGTHEYFRHGGAIGCSATPSRVLPGMRMAGHYGNKRVTVQNLLVMRAHPDHDVILVRGAVPGPNGGLVLIRRAVKSPRAATA